jgi:hypothetical protein
MNQFKTDQDRAHAIAALIKADLLPIKVGDTRVSRVDQDLDVQLEAQRKAEHGKVQPET